MAMIAQANAKTTAQITRKQQRQDNKLLWMEMKKINLSLLGHLILLRSMELMSKFKMWLIPKTHHRWRKAKGRQRSVHSVCAVASNASSIEHGRHMIMTSWSCWSWFTSIRRLGWRWDLLWSTFSWSKTRLSPKVPRQSLLMFFCHTLSSSSMGSLRTRCQFLDRLERAISFYSQWYS